MVFLKALFRKSLFCRRSKSTEAVADKMEQVDLVRGKNMLQVKFRITNIRGSPNFSWFTSQEYSLSDLVVQVKLIIDRCYNSFQSYDCNLLFFIRFVKKHKGDTRITFSSIKFGLKDKVFVCDDTAWRLVHEHSQVFASKTEYSFDITVNLDSKLSSTSMCSFESLHDDADLTDFELRGEDGAVSMHKAVLAAYSPVFKTMLSGKWRETAEGSVDVPGTSKETLQYFKDYLYLQKLPEMGLEQLILLASYYMIPELENQCTVKVLNKLTAQNAYHFAEFAIGHKIKKLFFGILDKVEKGVIKVKDMNY